MSVFLIFFLGILDFVARCLGLIGFVPGPLRASGLIPDLISLFQILSDSYLWFGVLCTLHRQKLGLSKSLLAIVLQNHPTSDSLTPA